MFPMVYQRIACLFDTVESVSDPDFGATPGVETANPMGEACLKAAVVEYSLDVVHIREVGIFLWSKLRY